MLGYANIQATYMKLNAPFLVYAFYMYDSLEQGTFSIEKAGEYQVQNSAKTKWSGKLRIHAPLKSKKGFASTGVLPSSANFYAFVNKAEAEVFLRRKIESLTKEAAQVNEHYDRRIDYLNNYSLP